MTKERMEEIFLDIIKGISDDEREELKKQLKSIDITSFDDEYVIELFESLKDEICSRKAYFSKGYCLEVIQEIARILDLDEVIAVLEGHIQPEDGLLHCPSCNTPQLITDDYFVCECGWTTNY